MEKAIQAQAFSQEVAQVSTLLETSIVHGLSQTDAKNRLDQYGLNTIEEAETASWLRLLWSQFKSPMVVLLALAAAVSVYFQDYPDAVAIVSVLIINSGVGFMMEFQAGRSMEALKRMTSQRATVVRDGRIIEIDTDQLVPGDILSIEAGNLIAADARLIDAPQLQADESTLTGESLPVEKICSGLPANTPLADRRNMVYRGSHVTRGNGKAIVTATGMNTELGRIAGLVQTGHSSSTPLELKLLAFSKRLIWMTGGIVVLVFLAGILNGRPLFLMFTTAVALAVAAIPEGLPIVATLALARGMMRMARKNVIVRRLSSVETLGGTSVICTDKTGTLTENRIKVAQVVTNENTYTPDELTSSAEGQTCEVFTRAAVLCNTASLTNNENAGIGDPLEVGLLQFAQGLGVDIETLRQQWPIQEQEPFSSETRLMATRHTHAGTVVTYAKGAPEDLLTRCTGLLTEHGTAPLDEAGRNDWIGKTTALSLKGYKVIGIAFKDDGSALTDNLVFAGLLCLIDPPRKEVKQAIQECRQAGISVVMITGDHPATAFKIALDLSLVNETDEQPILGRDIKPFERMIDEDKEQMSKARVFARVSPQNKMDLVKVLQERKLVVAMTGDGVNDAPALKSADIGIAMGLRGTQVAQEVADMVLKDDSFASIVYAIREGRNIFTNIRHFVVYLLSHNLGELLIIAITAILNLPYQLLPLQILYVNLATDVMPALALGTTKGDGRVMKQAPRNSEDPIIDARQWRIMAFYGIVLALTTQAAVQLGIYLHNDATWEAHSANNILYYTLVICQLLHVFNMDSKPIHKSSVVRNPYIWLALAATSLLIAMSYWIVPTRTLLGLQPLVMIDWTIILGAGLTSLLIVQVAKLLGLINQQ